MLIFPRLNTNRLILRKIEVEDFPALVKYANNKKISDHIASMPHPYQESNAVFRISFVVQGFKNKVRYVFAIILKERNEFIGEVSLHLMDRHNNHAQLAYWIGEPFWNKGIMTEAVEAVLQFGFDKLAVDLIYADYHVNNKASEKVMLNNGMKRHGVNGNLVLYRLTKEEYGNQQIS